MIDFRYHLVSIIAVFLALAVGIVVGTAALNGPIQDGLRRSIQEQAQDKRVLEGEVRDLQAQVAASDEFATALAPQLVGKALADERVLLVTTPQTPDELVERLRPVLVDAGAVITGVLQVRDALGEPAQRQLLEDLVAQVVPAGLDLPDGKAVERATAELAAALATPARGKSVEISEAQAVLSAFEEANLVQFDGDGGTLSQATLAVVMSGPAPIGDAEDSQTAQREAILSLAAALDDRARGAVVAGPATSATARGLVGALRADSSRAAEVSGVDNADRGIGQVAVVLALAEQARGGSGQYGAGPRATAPLPSAAAS